MTKLGEIVPVDTFNRENSHKPSDSVAEHGLDKLSEADREILENTSVNGDVVTTYTGDRR